MSGELPPLTTRGSDAKVPTRYRALPNRTRRCRRMMKTDPAITQAFPLRSRAGRAAKDWNGKEGVDGSSPSEGSGGSSHDCGRPAVTLAAQPDGRSDSRAAPERADRGIARGIAGPAG